MGAVRGEVDVRTYSALSWTGLWLAADEASAAIGITVGTVGCVVLVVVATVIWKKSVPAVGIGGRQLPMIAVCVGVHKVRGKAWAMCKWSQAAGQVTDASFEERRLFALRGGDLFRSGRRSKIFGERG